jgi:hypothetical protein
MCHFADARRNAGIHESFQWNFNGVLLVCWSYGLWNADKLECYIVQPYSTASSFEDTGDFSPGTAME